ncbi:Ribosomal RNA processing protein 1 B [Cichlidogyrus casuarinus]|uniref:Ribosomal RNA processing protein 1 B n=1 Tax=Cichlidogyrus casuarinus TaxID=1844966 RepID=A0ABD2QM83_9PLAT
MAFEASTKDIKYLAKGLASHEMAIRIKCIKLISVLYTNDDLEIDYTQSLYICKGLFYALWQQDKLLLQEQVVKRYVDLVPKIKNEVKRNYYISSMLETICREWTSIDHYREDKFLMLLREFFVKSMQTASTPEQVESLCIYCFEKILNDDIKNAMGLKFYFADFLMEEFAKNKFPVQALFRCLELSVNTALVLPKSDSYTTKLFQVSFALAGLLHKYRKTETVRLQSVADSIMQLVPEHPKFRKSLLALARIFTSVIQERTKLMDSKSRKRKAPGIKDTQVSKKVKAENPTQVAIPTTNSTEATTAGKHENPDLSPGKRVTFGKIYRKKFKTTKRLIPPKPVSSHPGRGILRKSL